MDHVHHEIFAIKSKNIFEWAVKKVTVSYELLKNYDELYVVKKL